MPPKTLDELSESDLSLVKYACELRTRGISVGSLEGFLDAWEDHGDSPRRKVARDIVDRFGSYSVFHSFVMLLRKFPWLVLGEEAADGCWSQPELDGWDWKYVRQAQEFLRKGICIDTMEDLLEARGVLNKTSAAATLHRRFGSYANFLYTVRWANDRYPSPVAGALGGCCAGPATEDDDLEDNGDGDGEWDTGDPFGGASEDEVEDPEGEGEDPKCEVCGRLKFKCVRNCDDCGKEMCEAYLYSWPVQNEHGLFYRYRDHICRTCFDKRIASLREPSPLDDPWPEVPDVAVTPKGMDMGSSVEGIEFPCPVSRFCLFGDNKGRCLEPLLGQVNNRVIGPCTQFVADPYTSAMLPGGREKVRGILKNYGINVQPGNRDYTAMVLSQIVGVISPVVRNLNGPERLQFVTRIANQLTRWKEVELEQFLAASLEDPEE